MTTILPVLPYTGRFAEWLKRVRQGGNLSQDALAELLGCSVDTIQRCETGNRPSPHFLEQLLAQVPVPPAERAGFIAWARSEGTPQKSPAIPAARSPSASLPRPLTPLVGRERECREIAALLREEARLVTLTGEAGIGKTRLALAVAGDVQAGFANGVAYVDLAPVRDPALVPAAIASALGMIETAPEAWPARLADLLAPQQLLLVLDNFEQILPAVPLLGVLLRAASRLTILVTSRVILEVEGEQVYRLAPLPAAEAQALFVTRAHAVQPGLELNTENTAAIAAICTQLAGLPLALELAAAHSRLLPPPTLRAQLEPSLPLLTGGRRDSPPRQQTLRTALDWSYAALRTAEQQLFRRLSVFVGGGSLNAVASLYQHPLAKTILDVETLLNHSLIRTDNATPDPRITMLEPVREYAQEQLVANGEEELAQRAHALYYLALTEEAAPALRGAQPQSWLTRLDQEYANLRAAVDWAVIQDMNLAGRLVAGLWPFWLARGHWSAGRRWLEAILSASDSYSPALRACLLQGAGTLARVQGDYQPAQVWLEESLGLYQKLEDQRGAAGCLYELADIVRAAGDRTQAIRLGAESLALYRATRDPVGIANALLFCVSEDDAAAEARWQEALDLSREIQYMPGIAMALHRLGALAEEQDEAHATALHEESLALFRELGDLRRIATVTEVLGEVALASGDLPRARARFEEALPLWQRVGERSGLLSVYYNFADLEQAAEQWAAMADYATRGLAEARAAGNQAGIRDGLLLLGHARLHLGQSAAALPAYGEALTYVNEQTRPRILASVLVGLASLAAVAGQFEHAAACLGAASARGPLSAHVRVDYDQALAIVRAGLPDEDLAAAEGIGHTWSTVDITALPWRDLVKPTEQDANSRV